MNIRNILKKVIYLRIFHLLYIQLYAFRHLTGLHIALHNTTKQCCGSESGSTESTCFWVSWIRIRILLSSWKNSKKNLDSYYFVTLFDFLSLKTDVNVASKSSKQKNLVFAGILMVNDKNSRIRSQDPDPDPFVRGMDPRIRIRIHPIMSWIRNTATKISPSYGTPPQLIQGRAPPPPLALTTLNASPTSIINLSSPTEEKFEI